MKRIFLSLIILCSFLTFGNRYAFSQGLISSCNLPPSCQEVPICTDTADCFKFDLYEPKPLATDPTKMVIKVMVTNYSESTLTNVALELPNGVPASQPINGAVFRNRYNHDVTNPFDPSAWIPGMGPSIMYKNRLATGGTFSYGGFEVYYFVVKASDLTADRIMRVAARAGRPYQPTRIGDVFFDFDNCVTPCPPPKDFECFKKDCCFSYSLAVEPNGGTEPDEAAIGFTVENDCAKEVTEVNISLPVGTDVSRLDAFASNSFEDFTVNTSNPLLLRFIADPSAAKVWNSPNDAETFIYDLPRDLIRQAGKNLATITVITTSGTFSQTFNLTNDSCGIGPLPVELMNFDGKSVKEGVALTWKTASEKNNDRFEVQRSTDGHNFEKIGIVKGNGSSSVAREYAFLDKQPLAGMNYYRLNQVDFDGTNALSKVVQINSGDQSKAISVQLVPNPCRGENCTVQLTGFSGSNQVTIELRDITGRLVYSKQLNANQNEIVLPKMDARNGVYILTAKDGTKVTYRKVMIE